VGYLIPNTGEKREGMSVCAGGHRWEGHTVNGVINALTSSPWGLFIGEVRGVW
jgi:hypothetical protein